MERERYFNQKRIQQADSLAVKPAKRPSKLQFESDEAANDIAACEVCGEWFQFDELTECASCCRAMCEACASPEANNEWCQACNYLYGED